MEKSPALESMIAGKAPQSPEEWTELGQYLGTVAKFLHVVNAELDVVGFGMDVIEKILEILADVQAPETQALMKEVVSRAYTSGRIHVSEVQGEEGPKGSTGPTESDDGWLLP